MAETSSHGQHTFTGKSKDSIQHALDDALRQANVGVPDSGRRCTVTEWGGTTPNFAGQKEYFVTISCR